MKVIVFYDGSCPFCVTSARVLRRLDWFHQLNLVNLYQAGVLEKYGINQEKAIQRIQVRTKKEKVLEGLRGIVYLSLFLPLLWPLIPLIQFCEWIGLGEKLYDWIAKNRLIFPTPGTCPIKKPD